MLPRLGAISTVCMHIPLCAPSGWLSCRRHRHWTLDHSAAPIGWSQGGLNAAMESVTRSTSSGSKLEGNLPALDPLRDSPWCPAYG